MNKVLCAATAAGLAAACLSGAAFAQAPGGGFGAMIMNADANKDGKVSKAEMQTARAAQFAKMDKNGDGFLTTDELGDHADRAMRADANKDGKVSKAEFTNVDMMFDHMDKNKDGFIDQSELPTGRPGG